MPVRQFAGRGKSPGARTFAPLPRKWQRTGPRGPLDCERRVAGAGRQPGLWTRMCGSWGARGVSLWIAVRGTVDWPESRGRLPALSSRIAVHWLWRRIGTAW
jgi:hypothetical protein